MHTGKYLGLDALHISLSIREFWKLLLVLLNISSDSVVKSDKFRMTKMIIERPFNELDRGDQLWIVRREAGAKPFRSARIRTFRAYPRQVQTARRFDPRLKASRDFGASKRSSMPPRFENTGLCRYEFKSRSSRSTRTCGGSKILFSSRHLSA
jgi:hypothetical protein